MRSIRPSRRAAARLLPLSAATVATLTLSSVASAQPGGVGPSCEVDTNSPKELLVASLALQRVAAAADPVARQNALKNAMKELTNKADRWRARNPLGYQMLLAQTLSYWIADENTPVQTTRGAIGAIDTPDEPIDLVAATDLAFKAVVEGAPSCAADVRALRQSEGWLAMTRKALDLSSSNPDSAEIYAQHSVTLLPVENPYPYQVLGIVAQRRGDIPGAIAQWTKAIEASGTDSSYRDIRQSSLFYKGLYELQLAREQSGDQQKSSLNTAVATMKEYLADFGSTQDAATVMQGLAEAYVTLGETDKVPSIYAGMLATPDAYTDYQLTMGGVIASQAERNADAVTFFSAAIGKNPNQRDALRNLAAALYAEKRYDEMFKPLETLTGIDPNNVDAWTMFAFAYQGKAQVATAPADKKKYTDSLIVFSGKADSLPVKLTVDEFQRNPESVTFSVSLEGNATTPKANTLEVEFLDANGNVVASASESVEPIAKGERKTVRLEAQGSGVVAYRYKPLS
jgi:tetratricopeptide (TPR) repeat protein